MIPGNQGREVCSRKGRCLGVSGNLMHHHPDLQMVLMAELARRMKALQWSSFPKAIDPFRDPDRVADRHLENLVTGRDPHPHHSKKFRFTL